MKDVANTSPQTAQQVVDTYFMEHRAKLVDIAAYLDRIDRGKGEPVNDFRDDAFRRAISILTDGESHRAKRVLETVQRLLDYNAAIRGRDEGGFRSGVCNNRRHTVKYIDPHIHMVSRTTDDYQRMAQAGCVAITEPAFWAGFDRSSAQGFYDYFQQLTSYEPKRAAQFGIQHFTWLCINPKEADDPGFAREVVSLIPEFLDKGNVLGIGEIGLNKNTKNELIILEEQIALAAEHNQLVLVHTPHLEDKLKGTRLIMDALSASGIQPGRILIDHVEEHTVGEVLDRGFWAGMTLYPDTKVTPQRAADIIEMYGNERIWMNSAGDWGCSDPLAVPKARLEMRRRGHSAATIDKVTFDNPQTFLGQSSQFSID